MQLGEVILILLSTGKLVMGPFSVVVFGITVLWWLLKD